MEESNPKIKCDDDNSIRYLIMDLKRPFKELEIYKLARERCGWGKKIVRKHIDEMINDGILFEVKGTGRSRSLVVGECFYVLEDDHISLKKKIGDRKYSFGVPFPFQFVLDDKQEELILNAIRDYETSHFISQVEHMLGERTPIMTDLYKIFKSNKYGKTLSKGTINKIIDRLISKNFIERTTVLGSERVHLKVNSDYIYMIMAEKDRSLIWKFILNSANFVETCIENRAEWKKFLTIDCPECGYHSTKLGFKSKAIKNSASEFDDFQLESWVDIKISWKCPKCDFYYEYDGAI